MDELRVAIQQVIQGEITAADISYDNSNSGLVETTVQGAIDELAGYLAQLEDI